MPTRMVSITHALRNVSLTLLALVAMSAHAGVIEPVRGQLDPTDKGYALISQFAIDLGSSLEDALSRGVPLVFTLEFTIERKRWYWFDEQIVHRTIDYRLSYNALTQQYRLATEGRQDSYATLADALLMLGKVDGLVVAEKKAIRLGNAYTAELRMSLDKRQLPKPFQLDALASKDWQVEAIPLNWQFAPGVVGR
ncbi:MAG: DUF4390 domain-containing protein [Gammaproteobacteria bacterium]|nr:DUF4390 domain-containing protein [Gammaproteobacteria bacterium]MBU1416098.1 DUF4390 domain-containing protein [Gammaproteobacteria bacterium]